MARKKINGAKLVLFLGLAIVLVALFPWMVRAQMDTVKLGDLSAISNAAIYIAVEKGYFKEQGILNDISTFASAAKMVPALVAGELDVSVGAASAGLFNAIAQGASFRIVADKGQAREGTGFSLLTVRKDLVDSGQVKSVKDLKGKKVSILAKGIVQDYLVDKMAEEAGVSINDFEMTYLAGPNQFSAYQTKAIDAAYAVEPWAARFEDKNLAVRFRTPDQVKGLGPVQIAVIIYSGKFIKERRSVAQRWMNAYIKAAELFHKRGSKDPEIAIILEKYTKVPAAVIKVATPHYQDPNGRMILQSLTDQIEWFVRNSYMTQKVSIENAVDLSFLK